MPARDRYQDAVIKSLERDGWTDIDEQYKVIIGRRRLWIDIFATHRQPNTSTRCGITTPISPSTFYLSLPLE
jgi:hypothetical protein